ncbi:hypothetical protein JL720_12671 [Aureococcus anophagefferens]|nr:hypothetical protein JL720_12671 [Aureococcus anophagefferens]
MAELEQTTPTEPEPVVEQTTADDAEENYSNALQENIAKRGNNAYYYAHGHRNNAPAWDGDAARSPRPLRARAARSSTARARRSERPPRRNESVRADGADGAAGRGARRRAGSEPKLLEKTEIVRERRKLAITKYSWLDEDTKIRIYIPIEDGRFQQPGAVSLECTDKSVTLVADLGDEVHTFAVPQLYDKIESGAFKVKPNKIVVTLKKPKESKFKWYDLKK